MRTIEAISYFKKGIYPIWEDKRNCFGSDLSTMFLGITAEEIDKISIYFLINIFSEEYPFNDQVKQKWILSLFFAKY